MRGLVGQDLQRFVFQNHPEWECEKCQCGSNSPGPVENDEELIFLLINPTHFDQQTGNLSPIAFQEVHNRDLSVVRRKFATSDEYGKTVDEILSNGMKKIPPKIRKIEHVALAKAAEIRNERDSTDRYFGIYDTPLPGQSSHASIFTRPDVLDEKAKRAITRQKLHSIFSKNVLKLVEL